MKAVRKSFVQIFALSVISYCCGVNSQVTSEPGGVTICVGGSTILNCTLSANISTDDVQWYRTIRSTNTVLLGTDQDDDGSIVTDFYTKNGLTYAMLTISNATESYTGYYWVRVQSDNLCNTSLTVIRKPIAPMSVKFPTENTTDISFVVQWGAVIDQFVDSYLVLWNDKISTVQNAHVNETSCTVAGLTPNTTYVVVVFAHNKCGDGNSSFPIEITTNLSLSMDTSLTTIISDIVNPTSAGTTTASITTASFTTASINTTSINTASITTASITTASITTASITTASITTASINTASITTASINTASITTALSKPAVMTAGTTVSTVYSGSPTSHVGAESNSDSGVSSTGVIAMGVSGGIIAVAIVIVIICIMAYYWIVVYKRKNDKADKDKNDDDNNDDDKSEQFSRLQLPNVFRCVCACLNCYDRNTSTDVLSATNARAKHIDDPEHIYNDDPKRGDKHKGIPVIILKTKMKSQECVTVETPCTVPDVAGSEDLAVHPFAKMSTLQCTNIKSPHRMLHATRSMPHGTRNKQLVTQPFGVHPYAVVDLQKIIDQAASATKSLPLPLPPKDKQQAPLAAETAAVADDVNDEAPGTSTSHDITPHETITDGSRHDASGDTDADTNTDNNENTEKKFSYADLHPLPHSNKFIVTDDAFVKYADVK